MTSSGGHSALWLGPDEWLVVSDTEPAALVDERCRQHRNLSAPAAVVAQATTRNARSSALQ